MPRNGSGQYNLPYDWNDDKANGIKVLASRMQAQDQDIANALTGSLAKDGQTPLTGDLDFNNNKAVDLADGSDLGDAINVSQAQIGECQFYGVSTTTPAGTDGEDYDIAAFATVLTYPTYARFSFVCHFTCIVNPNARIDALAAKILKKSNGAGGYIALEAGDMIADKEYVAVYNEDISSSDIIIENPEIPYINPIKQFTALVGFFATQTVPDGFLECNGAAISRTTYLRLFTAIGTVFGIGDGSTTFNIPDMRGYFPRGWDNGRGIDPARAFGSSQNDGVGNISIPGSVSSFNTFEWISVVAGQASGVASRSDPGKSTWQNLNINAGTIETRSKNVAMMYCIKY